MYVRKSILILSLLSFFTGCNGNNDDNKRPTVNAGEDRNITVNTPTTLTAVENNETNETLSSYEWSENNSTLATTTSFDYISNEVGTHELTLTVTNSDGIKNSDEVTINVLENNTSTEITNSSETTEDTNTSNLIVENNLSDDSNRTESNDENNTTYYIEEEENNTSNENNVSDENEETITTSNNDENLSIEENTSENVAIEQSNEENIVTPIVPNNTSINENNVSKEPNNILPSNINAGKDQNVTTGNTVTLRGTGIVTYEWRENGQLLAETAEFSYVPKTAGEHTLIFTISTIDGLIYTDVLTITANEQ